MGITLKTKKHEEIYLFFKKYFYDVRSRWIHPSARANRA